MDHTIYDMSREEHIKYQWDIILKFYKLNREKYLYSGKDAYPLWPELNSGIFPLSLHFSMFRLTIENLASDEQKARWLPEVYSLKMVGGYAQTELGHGSNVAGLETTATFDKSKDQFIIHSPTVTSAKYWPGGLGLYGNHVIVFAKLLVEGDDYGMQPFLVPIRDKETHEHLPGIQTGDIGPKLGWTATDNGWGIFN